MQLSENGINTSPIAMKLNTHSKNRILFSALLSCCVAIAPAMPAQSCFSIDDNDVAHLLTKPTRAKAQQVVRMERLGVKPNTRQDNTPMVQRTLERLKQKALQGKETVLSFPKGVYHFYPERATKRTYFISNHDQENPKRVGIVLENWSGLRIEGNGATFVFHGSMLPIALVGSTDCTLRNLSIDFDDPCIAQVRIVENRGDEGIVFKPEPWTRYKVEGEAFYIVGYDRCWQANAAIAFEPSTRRVAYRTGDLNFSAKGIRRLGEGLFLAPHFRHSMLRPGMVVVLRNGERPAPALFLSQSLRVKMQHVDVHQAPGMGLLAQLCQDISLEGFNVRLRGDSDSRYFTTQADATHFSQCRGTVRVVDGLYENMMDDAINVHGVYLKITERIDDKTVQARFAHSQTYGFRWASRGDTVQFVSSRTMDAVGIHRIAAIKPLVSQEEEGVRSFRITFEDSLPQWDLSHEDIGIENLSWTPEVYFARNTVRNNRARGALFSSPRKTVVEQNLFDHTSGTAILLCGDCNGWYESGSCRDITIRENTFTNALTSLYQFTNAVISIYPEIPDLAHQQQYYHGGSEQSIRIIGNRFNTFDAPILYAKSADGLLFQDNIIQTNTAYPPFHPSQVRFLLERCHRVRIE